MGGAAAAGGGVEIAGGDEADGPVSTVTGGTEGGGRWARASSTLERTAMVGALGTGAAVVGVGAGVSVACPGRTSPASTDRSSDLFVPDATRETFEESSDHGVTEGPDGRGVRYLEWTWDPNPEDNWSLTEYVFLLRGADGSVDAVHETHQLGLFGRDHWLRLLAGAGFDAHVVPEATTENRTPRQIFVGHRPAI